MIWIVFFIIVILIIAGGPKTSRYQEILSEQLTDWTNGGYDIFIQGGKDILNGVSYGYVYCNAQSNTLQLNSGDKIYLKVAISLNEGVLPHLSIYDDSGTRFFKEYIMNSGDNTFTFIVPETGNYRAFLANWSTKTNYSGKFSIMKVVRLANSYPANENAMGAGTIDAASNVTRTR